MLRTLLTVFLAVLAVLGSQSSAGKDVSGNETAGTDLCACNYTLVTLYAAAHPTRLDHFYTTSYDEVTGAGRAGWVRQPDAGRVLGDAAPGAIPLYRLWNNALSDHFYTISMVERDNTMLTSGWVYEGIAAYVLPRPACGTLPFYRSYNAGYWDHSYTTDPAKLMEAFRIYGFAFESVSGYIWPSD